MNRIDRRMFLAAAAAFAGSPRLALAKTPHTVLHGPAEQGGLVVGKTLSQAAVQVDGTSVGVTPDGIFAFGFAYDRTKPASIAVKYADGTHEALSLAPKVRAYEVQRINGLPQKEVTPPPDILARIHREAQAIRAARKRNTAGTGFAGGFDWPVPGIISSLYGSRRILNGVEMAPHLGIDIAAPEGTPIRAPADGVVSLVGDYYLDGGFTLLDHGHGVSTCYVHQQKRMVKTGGTVSRGQVIGLLGQTGRATGPNLHWGLNWFQIKLDPSLVTPAPEPPRA